MRNPVHAALRATRPVATRHARLAALLIAALFAQSICAQPVSKDVIRPENIDEGTGPRIRPIETRPPVPDADAAKKGVPTARRIAVKGPDGKVSYVYKCGDEFTDSPVCSAPVKPSRMLPTEAELARCKTLHSGNYVPWYCR